MASAPEPRDGSKDAAAKPHTSSDRFVGKSDTLEDSLKKQTIGLVRLEDFQKRRAEIEEEKRRQAAKTDELKPQEKKRKKRKSKLARTTTLSFDDDDGGGDGDGDGGSEPRLLQKKRKKTEPAGGAPSAQGKSSFKNPDVDTSFLPDRQREEEDRRLREALRQEWLQKQARMKEEEIEITYSYWDGSGHRKSVTCKKGDTIAQFLEKCRVQIPELRGVNVDNLMYVKEDLIISHHLSFYDMIVSKSRGKSGPLFNFDVHDDVRLLADARVEKDESHAGKVVERNWYNRNKHIFPASRWEVFELGKDYGAYTISDSRR